MAQDGSSGLSESQVDLRSARMAQQEGVHFLLSALQLCFSHDNSTRTDSHCETGGDVHKLDGWTINEWASWAKMKSRVATSTCTNNGKLKEEMSQLKQRIVCLEAQICVSAHSFYGVDPLSGCDPWAGASISEQASGHREYSVLAESCILDPWASWKPRCGLPLIEVESSRVFDPMEEIEDFVGAWSPLETNLATSPVNMDDLAHPTGNVTERSDDSVGVVLELRGTPAFHLIPSVGTWLPPRHFPFPDCIPHPKCLNDSGTEGREIGGRNLDE